MDHASAEKIATEIQSASKLCNQSLVVLMANETLGQVDAYGKLVATFMANCYLNILAPIWRNHPALKPPEMEGASTPAKPTLSAESRASLLAFISAARGALTTIGPLLAASSDANGPTQDGLPEIEEALAAIETFLKTHDVAPL